MALLPDKLNTGTLGGVMNGQVWKGTMDANGLFYDIMLVQFYSATE